jgi:hypothetical protein
VPAERPQYTGFLDIQLIPLETHVSIGDTRIFEQTLGGYSQLREETNRGLVLQTLNRLMEAGQLQTAGELLAVAVEAAPEIVGSGSDRW